MVRVMVIQAEVMPEHILVAMAEVAEQDSAITAVTVSTTTATTVTATFSIAISSSASFVVIGFSPHALIYISV